MKTSARALLLFAREPRTAQVKTRLEPAVGQQGALSLYRLLLARQINLVNSFPDVTRQCWIDGFSQHQDFAGFSGECLQQQGEELGARMAHALDIALQTHEFTVLIGCDCPQLDADYIEKAFRALESGQDAVFGPARDGGYVLVGLRNPSPSLFQDIDWGTVKVMGQTRVLAEALGLSWQELSTLNDIDEPEDLKFLGPELQALWLEACKEHKNQG